MRGVVLVAVAVALAGCMPYPERTDIEVAQRNELIRLIQIEKAAILEATTGEEVILHHARLDVYESDLKKLDAAFLRRVREWEDYNDAMAAAWGEAKGSRCTSVTVGGVTNTQCQ